MEQELKEIISYYAGSNAQALHFVPEIEADYFGALLRIEALHLICGNVWVRCTYGMVGAVPFSTLTSRIADVVYKAIIRWRERQGDRNLF